MNYTVLIHKNLVPQNILFLVTYGDRGFCWTLKISFLYMPENEQES